jgi:hypothetical protein
LFTIFEFITSILPAREEDAVTSVPFTVVMFAAREELLVFNEDCNPSIFVAADELLVVTTPLKFTIAELNEDDALDSDELIVFMSNAIDALWFANAACDSMIEAAAAITSADPDVVKLACNTSILPANEDEKFTDVVCVVVISAANDALLVFILEESPVIVVAADELYVVTAPCTFVIDDASDAELFVTDVDIVSTFPAIEELAFTKVS